MKYIILCLTLTMVQTIANAADGKAYAFRFQPVDGESYTYETKSDSREEAYEKAATSCFQYFKKGRHISMEKGLDLIDVCANPRSI